MFIKAIMGVFVSNCWMLHLNMMLHDGMTQSDLWDKPYSLMLQIKKQTVKLLSKEHVQQSVFVSIKMFYGYFFYTAQNF